MAEAISPNRLQPDSPLKDNVAYINDNFDKVVTAVNDVGSKLSDVGTFSVVNVQAGNRVILTTNVTDEKDEYIADRLSVFPRYQIFIDTNNDYNYLLPDGASISGTGSTNMSFGWWQARVIPTGSPANTKAVVYAIIRNYDTVDHLAYISLDVGYMSAPLEGIFR